MVEAECHRCGRQWDYTGRSEHYGTCPNCKTSVKLDRGGGGEAAETAEASESSDETAPTVEVAMGAGEAREVGLTEAVEGLDRSVTELYQLADGRDGVVGDLARRAGELEERADDLEAAIEEVAELVESWMEWEYPAVEEESGIDWQSDLLADPDQDDGDPAIAEIVAEVET